MTTNESAPGEAGADSRRNIQASDVVAAILITELEAKLAQVQALADEWEGLDPEKHADWDTLQAVVRDLRHALGPPETHRPVIKNIRRIHREHQGGVDSVWVGLEWKGEPFLEGWLVENDPMAEASRDGG